MSAYSPPDRSDAAASVDLADHTYHRAARRPDIDTMRAIACIALVSYHVVGSAPGNGLELPYDHWLAMLNRTPIDLRMPLFAFISGLVFVALPARGGKAAILAKARRLLVPLVVVGTLFWLVRAAMGIAQAPLWSVPFLPYEHYWFLQATFLIMAAHLGLTWALKGQDRLAALWLAGGAILWRLALPDIAPDLFAANGAIKLMPFFCVGYLAARSPGLWEWRPSAMGAVPARRGQGLALLAAVLLAGSVLAVLPDAQGMTWRRAMTLWIGGAGCLALVLIRPCSAQLAALGRHSFAIYLFHVFFTAGTRQVLLALDPSLAPGALWLPCLAAGLAGPLVVARLAMRHPLGAKLLLGLPLPSVTQRAVLSRFGRTWAALSRGSEHRRPAHGHLDRPVAWHFRSRRGEPALAARTAGADAAGGGAGRAADRDPWRLDHGRGV